MKRYNPREIEPKWQDVWLDNEVYVVSNDGPKPKFYSLVEFPYPSGAGLHVGHCRPYITFDIMNRWRRMNGENVLFPIGWDSFGLPAEQYAIKTGVHPSETTITNINNFRNQARSLGLSFDWSREFSTADPKIYKWTQWIFLQFYKHGLAYQGESLVWWCEELKSVLADEEVIDGKSERGDYQCERRPLRQWMLAITKYADRLYDDLDNVDYIEPVKIQQRNWIGRSKGAEIKFQVDGSTEIIKVFTTRPDTLFGATYMVLAPDNLLVAKIAKPDQKDEIENYIKQTAQKSELTRQEDVKDKSGVFTGAYAVNPANQAKIPIWISDYVLMGYGTGAIMAVPAHDERDYDFAKKFNLPITYVIEPVFGEKQGDETEKEAIIAILRNPKTNEILILDWGKRQNRFGGHLLVGGGLDKDEDEISCAAREIAEETGYTNVQYVKSLPYFIHNYFFSNVKNKNYYAKCRGLLFDLVDDSLAETKLDEGEKNKFTTQWVKAEKVSRLIEDDAHRYVYDALTSDKCFHDEGLMVNSGNYDGMTSAKARDEITDSLNAQGVAEFVTNYKLRDWVFSRQRYWGEPFPVVWVKKEDSLKADGEVASLLPNDPVTKEVDGKQLVAMPIPLSYLPVELPNVADFQPKGLGQGPLFEAKDWMQVWYNLQTGETVSRSEAKPEGEMWVEADRETDTMPNWAGSSWYYLRYLDPHNDKELANREKIEKWMPVNWYNGGMEHTTLHLLYSRFWHKFLFDINVVNTPEPYTKRTSHGMVLSEDGRKMSKSWGNVIDPMEIVNDYGADTLRLYIAFIGPFDQTVTWSINGVAGCRRFIERFWTLCQEFLNSGTGINKLAEITNSELKTIIMKTNQRVSNNLPRLGFNTAVSALMEAVNSLYKLKLEIKFSDAPDDWSATLRDLIIISSPFMPHLCEDLWQQFGFDQSVLSQIWPEVDQAALISDKITVVIQINGKLRDELIVERDISGDNLLEQAKKQPKIANLINGKEIVRTIYIANKLINIVIK